MRKLSIAALLFIACQFFVAPKSNALDHSTRQTPRHGRLAIAANSLWVPMYGDSRFKIADDMIATLFVEKGSLIEYKQTGVWPQSSAFLLRLKQVPARDSNRATQRTLVVDIAYKNNPSTQQWESYAVSWRYDIADVKKPANYRSKGLHTGCSQRPAEEMSETGGPDFL
jgi:hypothetical protein